THSGGGEIEQHRRAKPSGADDKHARATERCLPRSADLVQHNVSRVALQLLVTQHQHYRLVVHFGGNIATASTSNKAPGRASSGTPSVVLAGGAAVLTFLARTSRNSAMFLPISTM